MIGVDTVATAIVPTCERYAESDFYAANGSFEIPPCQSKCPYNIFHDRNSMIL